MHPIIYTGLAAITVLSLAGVLLHTPTPEKEPEVYVVTSKPVEERANTLMYVYVSPQEKEWSALCSEYGYKVIKIDNLGGFVGCKKTMSDYEEPVIPWNLPAYRN